jgi:hypothetical protein
MYCTLGAGYVCSSTKGRWQLAVELGEDEGLYFAARILDFCVTATSHGFFVGEKNVGGVVVEVLGRGRVAVLYIC